jgi:hypothetical protein
VRRTGEGYGEVRRRREEMCSEIRK